MFNRIGLPDDPAVVKPLRLMLVPALLWWLALAAGQLLIKPTLYPDPAPGLLAALQNTQGISTSPRDAVVSHLAHGGQLRTTRLTWWPPSYQFLPWLFMKFLSLDIGDAVALTVRLCLLAGLCGWGLYFAKILGPLPALLAAALLSTWRFFHHNLFFYDGGELLLFTAAPWVLLLIGGAVHNGRATDLALAGAGCAALFALKYSALALSVSFSIAAGLCILLQKKRHTLARCALLIGTCVGALVLGWLTLAAGGPTPASFGQRHGWNAMQVLWHWLSWPLNLGDLDALSRRLLFNDDSTEADLLKLALPGAVALLAIVPLVPSLVQNSSAANPARRFYLLAGVISLLLTLLLVSVVGMLGGALSWEARYYRIPVLMLFPFLLGALAGNLASRSARRIAASLPLIGILTVSSTYGVTVLLHKTTSQLTDARFPNTLWHGLSLPILDRSTPITEVINNIHQHLEKNPSHVLVVGDARLALPFADRPLAVWHDTLLPSVPPSADAPATTPVILINTLARRARPTLADLQAHPTWEPANTIPITDHWLLVHLRPRPLPPP